MPEVRSSLKLICDEASNHNAMSKTCKKKNIVTLLEFVILKTLMEKVIFFFIHQQDNILIG